MSVSLNLLTTQISSRVWYFPSLCSVFSFFQKQWPRTKSCAEAEDPRVRALPNGEKKWKRLVTNFKKSYLILNRLSSSVTNNLLSQIIKRYKVMSS